MVTSIKEKVLSKIRSSENEGLLKEVLSIIEFDEDDNVQAIFSNKQKDLIKDSQEQIKNGISSGHLEVKEKIGKWLDT